MTNKEKCLKMWQWLAENPACDKFDFLLYCKDTNQEELIENTYLCWACIEADKKATDVSPFAFADELTPCKVCPVTWVIQPSDGNYTCMSNSSPYLGWVHAESLTEIKRYATYIVNLITNTW